MEVSIGPDEEQREIPTKPAAGDVVSKNKNAAASGDQESGERTNTVRKDLSFIKTFGAQRKRRCGSIGADPTHELWIDVANRERS